VARDQQVPLIEDPMADVLSDAKLKADQLHPNAAGHALLAKKLLAALTTIGYVR
jgi:lysophospholipase L1-like esterase